MRMSDEEKARLRALVEGGPPSSEAARVNAGSTQGPDKAANRTEPEDGQGADLQARREQS